MGSAHGLMRDDPSPLNPRNPLETYKLLSLGIRKRSNMYGNYNYFFLSSPEPLFTRNQSDNYKLFIMIIQFFSILASRLVPPGASY